MQQTPSKLLDKSACSNCCKKFNNMFVTQHQCKRCLRYVCKQCCSKKKLIFTANLTNHLKNGIIRPVEHRTCDICFPMSQNINKIVKNNKVIFNEQSKLGSEWVDLLQMNKNILQESDKKQNKPVTYNKQNIIGQKWAYLSTSHRQLLGLSMNSMNSQQANKKLSNILQKSKSSKNDSFIATYLLCYCNQENSIKILRCLCQIKQNYSLDNINQYLNLLIDNDKQFSDKKQIKNLINFTNKFASSILNISDLFLPLLPIQSVNQIIHEMLLGSSPTAIQITASYILYYFKDTVLNSKITDQQIKTIIKNTLTAQILQKGIKQIRSLIIKKSKKTDGVISQTYNINFLSPQNTTIQKSQIDDMKQQDQILKKINDASEYLRKIQENQLNDEQFDLGEMENIDKYLDLIISENQKSINEIDAFDKMLSSIEEKLYQVNNSN